MARQAMTGRLPISVVVLMPLVFDGGVRGQTAPASVVDYVNPVAAVPLAALKATRERPLFSATRRPPPAITVAAPPPPPTSIADAVQPPEPPPLTLLGTLVGSIDRIAIVMTDGAKTANRLHEGEVVSGWMLVSINPRSAALTRDGRTVTLELRKTTEQSGDYPEDPKATETVAGDGLAADVAPADPELRPSVPTTVQRLIK